MGESAEGEPGRWVPPDPELAGADDVIKSLRLSDGEAHNALRFLMQRGWIELNDGRYQVSDSWYGAVFGVLDRQNLIQLRQGGGLR